MSDRNIPYPYVIEEGDGLAGTGVTAAELARVFPSTDLSAATDDIADGLYDWEHADPYPLALFDGARVDFSLRRLVHRSEEHTSELQSLMRISYAVFCLKKQTRQKENIKNRAHN